MLTELSVAPMEGLTTAVFRRIHFEMFGAADAYYLPFVTPTTEEKFTARQLKEVSTTVNKGIPVVPQLLSNKSQDFNWAAKRLYEMGYLEVNLNLGCPAGTVVAKNKGSGFLKVPDKLEQFLEEIFSADHKIRISIKTRLGWSDTEEFENLSRIYRKFPLSKLIIHARLKTDQYKGDSRVEVFDKYFASFPFPVGYNGDIRTLSQMQNILDTYPTLGDMMVGRAIIADPALFRKFRGGKAADKKELQTFAERLFEGYSEAFGSRKNAVMRMKEYWFLQLCLLSENPKLFKQLFKCREVADYEAIVKDIFGSCDVLDEPRYGWYKPL